MKTKNNTNFIGGLINEITSDCRMYFVRPINSFKRKFARIGKYRKPIIPFAFLCHLFCVLCLVLIFAPLRICFELIMFIFALILIACGFAAAALESYIGVHVLRFLELILNGIVSVFKWFNKIIKVKS